MKIFAACLSMFAVMGSRGALAQPRSAGVEISPFRIGASYSHSAFFNAKGEEGFNVTHFLDLGFEMTGAITQRIKYPGVYASYSCCMNIVEVAGNGAVFTLLAGPGATVGYAEDLRTGMGVFFGPTANVTGEFRFRAVPVSIALCMRPCIGLHQYSGAGSTQKMGVYCNGILSSIVPQIRVSYDLDRKEVETPPQRKRHLVSAGVELGYIAQFSVFCHYNYTTGDGYRVNREDTRIRFNSNEYLLGKVGLNAGSHFNLALCLGYQGISRRQRVFPICLRSTVLFGREDDPGRWLCYGGGGIGIRGGGKITGSAALAHAGFGYSLALTAGSRLDFLCSISGTYWHPDISGEKIKVRRSNEVLSGLCIGLGMSF